MMKFFDYDPYSKIREDIGRSDDGKIIIKSTADVEQELRENTIERNSKPEGWKGDFHKVASIPKIIALQWVEELKRMGAPCTNPFDNRNRAFLIAKLNNRDFGKLRTKDGNL